MSWTCKSVIISDLLIALFNKLYMLTVTCNTREWLSSLICSSAAKTSSFDSERCSNSAGGHRPVNWRPPQLGQLECLDNRHAGTELRQISLHSAERHVQHLGPLSVQRRVQWASFCTLALIVIACFIWSHAVHSSLLTSLVLTIALYSWYVVVLHFLKQSGITDWSSWPCDKQI